MGRAGNLAQRRDNSDPSGLGVFGNWGFAWPANRRIQYNRASADPNGKPWSEDKKYIVLERRALDRSGRAGLRPTVPPEQATGPFIMNPEGVSRLWVRGMMRGRSVPGALRAVRSRRSPIRCSPKIKGNPVARVFKGDMEIVRRRRTKFPIVATTYRLTEHFHYWTKHVHRTRSCSRKFFVEMSEQLAKEKGHQDRTVGQRSGPTAAR